MLETSADIFGSTVFSFTVPSRYTEKLGFTCHDPTSEMRSSLVDGKENEYFELKSYSSDTDKVAYYYSNDITKTDIATLKGSKNAVREVSMPPRD